MRYFWADCPGCLCHVAVNWSISPSGLSGSLRRWNAERNINDGRPFMAAHSENGTFPVACVCGTELTATAQAEGGEREANLRVTLG